MDLMWSRIYDVIIKTIACGEHYVVSAMKKNQMYRTNCFEIFGFDVLIDSDLKPWLLEVNLSPSLATDSPLDHTIKTQLLTDSFNCTTLRRFDRRKESLNKLKYRSKAAGHVQSGSATGKAKQYAVNTQLAGSIPLPTTGSTEIFMTNFQENPQVDFLIDRLVEEFDSEYEHGNLAEPLKRAMFLKYRDLIHETVSEFARRGNFVRIYPSRGSKIYDKFFTASKPLNKIIYKTLFTSDVLPYAGKHDDPTNLRIKMTQTITPIEQPKLDQKAPRERLASSSGLRPAKK